ncbi:TetR/AcrR family transcriptional regulator [Streptomyces sp. NPDC090798]|uniref:TetR/AcrR family transcriptional regulator n=1 Tax=Streptomyces sp. NPDC090798 TaxID=3365968 RepID=UPI00381E1AA1
MTADPRTPMRADARRNRDQILAAAKVVFQAQGADVPMEDIARSAGVGVGTLYRRFPDRESLIRAVARDSFGRVLEEVRAVAREEPSAWDTITRLLAHSRELRVTAQLALLSERARAVITGDPDIRGFRDEIFGLIDDLVAAAQREGSLRTDIGAGDIGVLLSLLVRHFPAADTGVADMMLHRATALILDGLRAPGMPLPGRPLVQGDLA